MNLKLGQNKPRFLDLPQIYCGVDAQLFPFDVQLKGVRLLHVHLRDHPEEVFHWNDRQVRAGKRMSK